MSHCWPLIIVLISSEAIDKHILQGKAENTLLIRNIHPGGGGIEAKGFGGIVEKPT